MRKTSILRLKEPPRIKKLKKKKNPSLITCQQNYGSLKIKIKFRVDDLHRHESETDISNSTYKTIMKPLS